HLGSVGLTVPFAVAMGALLARRSDERWIISTRRWTLAAWAFLGIGQLLGAHWAYVEVGWGGYFAWDPVENAALMPWLAATAFLHSVMVQEKKGMLKIWNMLLVALCLTILWGVLFPILSEAVTGESSAVRGPYYNFFLRSFGLPLLLLMGIGPLLAWRRTSLRALGRTFLWPAAVSVVAGGVLI